MAKGKAKIWLVCLECGAHWVRFCSGSRIMVEIRCPKCHGVDIEVDA